MPRSNKELFPTFSFTRVSDTKRLTANSVRCLEKAFNHFCKQSNGFIGSITVVFHVKTEIGQGDTARTLWMEFASTSKSFLSHSEKHWWSISVAQYLQLSESSKRIWASIRSQEDGCLMSWLTIKTVKVQKFGGTFEYSEKWSICTILACCHCRSSVQFRTVIRIKGDVGASSNQI
jgi:hypothetical protein